MEKLRLLRETIKLNGLDACIIPMTDPHMGEYVPDYWKIIQWLSSFSGSAATIVVTQEFAGLWTDSRYFIQAERQLKGSGIELMKLKVPHTPEYIDWICENIETGSVMGFNSEVVSIGLFRQLKEKLEPSGVKLKGTRDLTQDLWTDRMELPDSLVYDHTVFFAGLDRDEKIEKIRESMREKGVNYHLLSALDDIAWTFNIRASDVQYSPLAISFALISETNSLLFVDQDRISMELRNDLLESGVEILPYGQIYSTLTSLYSRARVYLSIASVNTQLYNSIPEDCTIVEGISIPTLNKSIKSGKEIAHVKNAMIRDGVALTKFYYWLENNLASGELSEISVSEKLEEFRAEQDYFMGASFATIAGYMEHGAIVHYEATTETDTTFATKGIFLLDSGGQYLDGTTDITRTISLGNPTDKQKKDFTLVLKGTIQLAMCVFPEGTRGYQIEVLARKALWNHGLNYGHGTGHGVGYFLNVHEGPQNIGSSASGSNDIALQPGMLISDEPGLYREGEYGIRTENLIVVKEVQETEFGKFLGFETLSLCYIDQKLIDADILEIEEINWLNNYHKKVYGALSPFLDEDIRDWLREKTKEMNND
ncbi:MAG: aminopeptidase P family protein [Bacteroidota bacterium]|nr:aminopeptidase P family protein [Bacteroidota bacterium]